MEELSKKNLIDKYNAAIKPFIDRNEFMCPQCFTPFKHFKDGRHYFGCGTSMSTTKPGFVSTALCYMRARERPLDYGNLNPHGYSYEEFD
ncbi:MAG TPA: hypothetical protein VGM30_24855 [Puia sp.]|jgi:hypothetical protein